MNYVLAKPESNPIYPYSLAQLRWDNPNFSIPDSVSEEDLLPFDCFPVAPSELPLVEDPRTQRVTESGPTQNEDGQWVQTWVIRDATETEITDWDAAHTVVYQPDWVAFKLLSQSSPEFKQIITQALLTDPVNALGLQTELNEVIRGADSRPFYAALSSVFNTVQPDPSVVRTFAAAARLMHLPADFVSMLLSLVPSDSEPEQPVEPSPPEDPSQEAVPPSPEDG